MATPTTRILWLLSLSYLILLVNPIPVTSNSLCPAELIYQYPNEGTWIENLAFRQNGDLLLTSIGHPERLHSIMPVPGAIPVPIIQSFPGVNSTLGITEMLPDIFYVLGNNFSLGDPGKTTVGAKLKTSAVFKVDFNTNESAPTPELVTRMPEASFLNELTKFNDTLLLASDSALGLIWAIDTETGSYSVVVKDPLMEPIPVGGQHLFAKLSLDPNTGAPLGPAKYLASSAIQSDAYIATQQGNGVQVVTPKGEVRVIAGKVNSTELAEPTATKFGRTWNDRDMLYVTTAGGAGFPVIQDRQMERVGAQLRVDLAACGGGLW